MKFILTLFYICCTSINLIAQPVADSLFQKLNSANDHQKVDLYLAIAKVNWRYSTDSIYKYSKKALDLAQQIDYINGEAKALSYIGVTHFYKANYDSVLYYYNAAIEKFKQSEDLGGAAITINNKGVLYKRMGEYSKAIECYNEAKVIQEEKGDLREVGGVLLNIGIIYYVQNDLDKALEYYIKALEQFESINDKIKIAGAYTNIGQVYAELNQNTKALEYYNKALILQRESDDIYGIANSLSNIGIINKTLGNFSESESHLNNSLELYMEMQDQDAIAYVYNHLGELYTFMKQWQKALDMYHKTIQIQESIGDNEGLAYVKYDLANLYFLTGEWNKAQHNLEESIKLSRSLNILDILQKSFLLLSKIDSVQGNNKKSLINFKTHTQYKDTIYNQESSRQIAEMQTKYETTKKEQEINQLQQEKIVSELKIKNDRIIGASSLAVLIIFLIFLFMLYRSKQRKNEAKLLLKNTMETEDKERKRLAEELHDGIGPLLSTVKLYINEIEVVNNNSSDKELLDESDKIIDEAICSARNLSHNLMPQNIENDGLIKSLQVFANRVCINNKPEIIFKHIDTGEYGLWQQVMIYRIITELINNSIKHSGADQIRIEFKKVGKILNVEYSDNGTGFSLEKVLKEGQGIGLKNVISRVSSLKGKVRFESSENQGFKAGIKIGIKNLYELN
ncbi:MAG: tetratricopeptide repeat protein [Bacteroidales bacterium]|nr:tetratricopeptide repeat protein [Bacteroidales bacterium]